jgi:glycosyltransferase involved in cell wall biosynthesis
MLAFNAVAFFAGSEGIKRFAMSAADALLDGQLSCRVRIFAPSCCRDQMPERYRPFTTFFWAFDPGRGAAFCNHFWSNLLSIHLRLSRLNAVMYSPLEVYAVVPFPRCVFTAHDCYADRFGDPRKQGQIGLGRRLTVRQLKKSHLFSVSDFTTRELGELHQIHAPQVETVLNWLDRDYECAPSPQHLEKVRSQLELPETFWLYVGGFRINKNLPLLFEAYAATMKREPNCPRLVIAGRIPESDTVFSGPFHAAIDRHPGLRERIIFPGFVPAEDLSSLYQLASLVICPSLYEGFGFPVIEALAVGTPVIAARAASLTELGLPANNHFSTTDPAELMTLLALACVEGTKRFASPLLDIFLPAKGEARFCAAVERWIDAN